MINRYQILNDELVEHIESLPEKDQNNWIFLAPHQEFSGRWYVDSLNQGFFLDFEEIIGSYRTVNPAGLEDFLDFAEELGYQVAFVEEPTKILEDFEHLNEPPVFSLNSTLDNTTNGFLPFQLQGFNYLRNLENKSGMAVWSTGVGKTALIAALIKQHVEVEKLFDLILVVVKSNNKYDMMIKLRQLGDIDSCIIDGLQPKRLEIYDLINTVSANEPVVAITNYEKFRQDEASIVDLFTNRRVLIFWDEMPMKLSNRDTLLYDSVKTALYNCGKGIKWEKHRPLSLRQYALTATPIENSPVGLLNQIRLLDPEVFPTINSWEKRYVAGRNFFSKEPETFKNLEEMGLRVEFMTHQVNKSDPDIAALFPAEYDNIRYVDWNPRHRKIYDRMQDLAKELAVRSREDPDVVRFNAFQLIGVLQMICDAPSMVAISATNRAKFEEALTEATDDEEYDRILEHQIGGSEAALGLIEALKEPPTNDGHTKLEVLREIIMEKHPDEKIVVFSKLANYIQPILTELFDEWGVSYVVYRGTDKQRLEAKNQFRNSDVRVFLSSDAGSDSIDLPEASVSIDYDEPMKWTTKIQRRNRIHRVNSEHKYVTYYTLRMANSVEDRIAEIISTKKEYHDSIYEGSTREVFASARMTSEDLNYILFGEFD